MSDFKTGLGELVRHVADLLDSSAQSVYGNLGTPYRPRYTPVMRALADGADSVGAITDRTRHTQGAISQTLALMVRDGLVQRGSADGGARAVSLTPAGQHALEWLEPHWQATFDAVEALEAEVGHPVREILADLSAALERESFGTRIVRQRERRPAE